ncbi:MAG TPA: nucleotide exchange factor GrpE [Kiritimatiellia bacterium]|nr:nucleotide exchange factor GrpE [Kiritimatiellia bacterium]
MNDKEKPDIESADETVADIPNPAGQNADEPRAAEAPSPSETDLLKERLLRLQADFDNFRKRSVRERAEWQSFATEDLIQDLLPVVDHYELGLATAQKNQTPPAVLDGLKLVYDQLLGVLKKRGVTPIAATPGTVFDPHRHEAISHIASEEHPADVIIAETRRGYMLGEKLMRPLQVVVSSGPAGNGEGSGG